MADLKAEVLNGFTQCTKDDVTLNNYIARSWTLGLLLYCFCLGSFANKLPHLPTYLVEPEEHQGRFRCHQQEGEEGGEGEGQEEESDQEQEG